MKLKWPDDFMGKVIQGDCLKVMRQMPDKCVDLCLTDPPYGIGLEYDGYQDSEDGLAIMMKKVMPEILRVSRVAMITPGHTNLWKYPEPDWLLSWYYGTTNQRSKVGFTSWQPVLFYGKDQYLSNGMGARADVIVDATVPDRRQTGDHPCPKPETIWAKLMCRASVKKGDVIFDPFGGSGTTGVVASRHDRQFILTELSGKYCSIARKRIAAEQAQGKLF